jgi:hypothetical protein
LRRIDEAHAEKVKECVNRSGGLRSSVAVCLVAELFCQLPAIAFAADCIEHVIGESSFGHTSASALLAEVRTWTAGNRTKKDLLHLGEKVAEEAREWERGWYAWYTTLAFPINKKTQHEIDASQEPLFVFDAALATVAATQPSERARGRQLGHYRMWFNAVAEALSRSLEAVACRAPRCSKRERKLIDTEYQWRAARLASLLSNAELTQDGFIA